MRKTLRGFLLILFTLLTSALVFSGCNIMHAEGEHAYEETTYAPTCTSRGYTLFRCSCGDEYEDDFLDALGHDYGEFVSNNDATFEADGTKTRTCKREGCGVSETITDEGTKKVVASLSFRSLSTTTENVVSNDIFSYCFKNEIITQGNVTYKVYKDQAKTKTVNLLATALNVGKNYFYVVANVDGVAEEYTIVINRNIYKSEVKPFTWTKCNTLSTSKVTTSISTKINLGTFFVTDINKYKLTYTLDKPVKGLIYIGGHVEDFFLEAGENVTFTSFTDDVLGDRDTLNAEKANVHNSLYRPGRPVQEKVTAGYVFSGAVSIYVEPIQSGTVNFKPLSFSVAYQEIPDKVVYVSNDRYKVGTHLYYGGSLTYFEDLKDGRSDIGNLVNIHDGGRLIQQSYYATDSAANGGVAYNPVQGGNGYGYSKLIDYDITDSGIYIKARAKNWKDTTPLGLSSSYMENWYILEDDYVRVDNTFVDFLDSNNTDSSHELPAAYFVSGLSNIAVYTGNDPWTDDPNLTTYAGENIQLGVSGFGYTWINGGETWATWYNDEGWGCGIYTPNADTLRSWMAGEGKTYNPYDNATTYFTLSQSYPIRPFEKTVYSYIMATGTVDEIRDLFKENKDYDTNEFPDSFADTYDLTNLDFTKAETMGFTQRHHSVITVYDESRKVTKISATGSDPYFGISLLGSDHRPLTSDYPYIAVEYMVPARFAKYYENNTPQIYIGVNNQQYITGTQSEAYNIIADGKWHVSYVYFGDCEWYTGTINYIRFDTHSGSAYGTEYYLKSIKLLSSPPTDPAYSDDYTPTAKTWLTWGTEEDNFIGTTDSGYYTEGGFTYVGGWFLVKGGIKHFEYLISEGSVTESYLKSAEAENYWQIAYRHVTGSRLDAGNTYPNIGDDGASAGYWLTIPEHLLEQGKTYKLAIRVITNSGKACLLKVLDMPAPARPV